jgi:hypothetical protein
MPNKRERFGGDPLSRFIGTVSVFGNKYEVYRNANSLEVCHEGCNGTFLFGDLTADNYGLPEGYKRQIEPLITPKRRIFIVAPASTAPETDKRHDICTTGKRGKLSDIYMNDEYTVVDSRQSLDAARRFAWSIGAKRPKVL